VAKVTLILPFLCAPELAEIEGCKGLETQKRGAMRAGERQEQARCHRGRDQTHRPDIDGEVIRSARLLHVDDVDLDASVEAARIAREYGLPVTSDIEQTSEGVRALIDAVTVPIFAEHVPAALTGEADMARALTALRGPHHSMVAVTLGARGAMLLEGAHLHHEPGVPVKPVDTTGAGDVFRGAFIHALLRGDSPRDILRFANAAAALSCTKMGAMSSAPTLADVTAFATKATKTD